MTMSMSLFPEERQPLLMIMDGHAMVHRSFRAISQQRNLTSSATGEDTTGVFGFTNVFLNALANHNPAYCAIAFDTSAPTFRHQQFEDYKAQRPPSPPELRPFPLPEPRKITSWAWISVRLRRSPASVSQLCCWRRPET